MGGERISATADLDTAGVKYWLDVYEVVHGNMVGEHRDTDALSFSFGSLFLKSMIELRLSPQQIAGMSDFQYRRTCGNDITYPDTEKYIRELAEGMLAAVSESKKRGLIMLWLGRLGGLADNLWSRWMSGFREIREFNAQSEQSQEWIDLLKSGRVYSEADIGDDGDRELALARLGAGRSLVETCLQCGMTPQEVIDFSAAEIEAFTGSTVNYHSLRNARYLATKMMTVIGESESAEV